MYNAIQKYGWDNVRHEILFEELPYEDALSKEMELIRTYKTNCRKYGDDYGYNMTDGGDGARGHVVSVEVRQRISAMRMGKNKGDECYKSRAVICDGIRYESITEFCNKNHLGRAMVEKWLNGKSAMQPEWYDRGLHLENQVAVITKQTAPPNFKIEYDGQIFNSQAEFARFIGVSPTLVCKWFKRNKVPRVHIDKGLKRIK